MKKAYAEGTFKNLCTQIETFLIFCEYFKLSSLRVSVKTLCVYAQFLNISFRSVSSINNYLSGVKTLHILQDMEYPQNNMTQLNLLLQGISRSKQQCYQKSNTYHTKNLNGYVQIFDFQSLISPCILGIVSVDVFF